MVTVFNLIHQTNENDDWLLAASSIILSKLYGFYISILRKVDPSLGSGDDIRPYLTAPLKNNRHALNALSSILVLVVDLSDVHAMDGSETDMIRCLKKFVNASAYVLFDRKNKVMGLQAKTNKKTDETAYAMDNLLRQAGFLISDVLCSYTRLVHAAEKLLTRRLDYIFSLIGSSMELSVQRSMIIVLKVLYDCNLAKHKRKSKSTQETDDEQDNVTTLCDDIIQHMHKSPIWNERSINAFKSIESDAVTNNMPEELNRKVMMELFSVTDMLDNHCFNTPRCKVQIKFQTKTNKKATRAFFKDAYVDWNATSIVTHIEGGDTSYWPLFRLTHFVWRMRLNNIILKFSAWDKSDPMDIAIRFHNSLDSHLKDTIHSHLDQVLKTSELSASTDCELRNKDWAQEAIASDQLKKIHNRIVTEKSSFSGCTTEIDTHDKDTLTQGDNSLVIDCMVESEDTPAGSLFENGNEDSQIGLFQDQTAEFVDNGSNNAGNGVQIDPSSMSFEKVNEDSGQDNVSQILENIQVGQTNGSSVIDIDNDMGVETNQTDGVMNSQMSLGTNMDMEMSMDLNASMDLNMSMEIDENADANMNVGNEMSLEPDNDEDDEDDGYCPGVKDTTQSSANETNYRTRSTTNKNKQKDTEVAKDSVTVEKEIASDEHMNEQHLSVNDSEYESDIVCEVMDDLEFRNSLDVDRDKDECDAGYKDSIDVQAGMTNPMIIKDAGGKRDRYEHGQREVADADEEEGEDEDSDDGDDDHNDKDNAADGGEIHNEGDDEEESESESNTEAEEDDEDEDDDDEGDDDGGKPGDLETECEHDVDYDDEDEDDTSDEDDEDDEEYKGESSEDDESSDEEEVPHRMKLGVRSRKSDSRTEGDSAKIVSKRVVGKKKTSKCEGQTTDDVDKTGTQMIEGTETGQMNEQQSGRFDWLAMNTANLLCQIDEVSKIHTHKHIFTISLVDTDCFLLST